MIQITNIKNKNCMTPSVDKNVEYLKFSLAVISYVK